MTKEVGYQPDRVKSVHPQRSDTVTRILTSLRDPSIGLTSSAGQDTLIFFGWGPSRQGRVLVSRVARSLEHAS